MSIADQAFRSAADAADECIDARGRIREDAGNIFADSHVPAGPAPSRRSDRNAPMQSGTSDLAHTALAHTAIAGTRLFARLVSRPTPQPVVPMSVETVLDTRAVDCYAVGLTTPQALPLCPTTLDAPPSETASGAKTGAARVRTTGQRTLSADRSGENRLAALESLAAANRHAAEQASVVIRIARQLRPAEPVADVSQRQRRSPAPSSNPASPLSNPPRLAPAIPATAGVAAPGFEPEPPAASAVATPKSTSREPISAELEVERFGWPEFMETWDDATWKQIDAVAEVIRATAASGRNVLGVASETTGAGSTTVLLAAARRLASAERRIVLVDADRHRPQLAVQLGISPQIGWIDIAAGDRRLAEAIIKSGDDRLMLLPLCGADRAAPHDAAGEKLAEYLGLLRDDFEIVLVDLGAGGESPILGDSSEAGPVLFVRSELGCLPGQPTSNSKPGCLPGEATSNGARGLGNDRVPKGTIGIVENFAEVDATNVPRSPSVPRNTPSEFCCQIDEAGRHAAA